MREKPNFIKYAIITTGVVKNKVTCNQNGIARSTIVASSAVSAAGKHSGSTVRSSFAPPGDRIVDWFSGSDSLNACLRLIQTRFYTLSVGQARERDCSRPYAGRRRRILPTKIKS